MNKHLPSYTLSFIVDDVSNSKGSAVRIFTNYLPSKFVFPAEEGYKYCVVCDRWVFKENKHCYKCQACTSKVILHFYTL